MSDYISMRYDLNLLPVFLALMEERSVTRAAARLGITQPALSNSLNRLRDTLRDPLFIRERYGIKPTQLAEEIAPTIEAALAQLDDLILNQQEFQPAKAERLFTLAPNSYVELVLMPALVARTRELAPGIKLRMTAFGNDLAETGVISGTTALVIGRIVDPPGNLVVQHLMDDGLACAVRKDHPDVRDHISREQYERLKHGTCSRRAGCGRASSRHWSNKTSSERLPFLSRTSWPCQRCLPSRITAQRCRD